MTPAPMTLRPARIAGRAAAFALGTMALAGCAGMTYGTGVPSTEQTMRDIIGIVDLTPEDKAPIAYRPRAGIVAPPTTATLPQPVDPATTAAAGFPQETTAARLVATPIGGGRARGGTFDANGQPVRQFLTEPPIEYRTPSPDAPMAIAPPPPEQRRRFSLRDLWPF